jgi:hypothetical protein
MTIATVRMNRYGHLEVESLQSTDKQDIYIQNDMDIIYFMSNLLPEDRKEVEKGYTVEAVIDELYFSK